MAEDSAAVVDHALLDSVLPLVPGLIGALNEGIDVADVGCGSGHAVNVMARAFPASRFRGYDFSDEAIAAARAETAALGVTNAHFEVRDVTEFEESAVFDLVTAFDAIHDQAHPARVLGNIHTALRPEGTFLMVDFKASSDVADNIGVPAATFLYTVSTMHCMTVSLGLGGDGLGTAWGRQLAEAMLIEAGFAAVHVQELEADPFNYYYVSRKAPPA
jgi:SAM-dependent methyltransferase